jgi:hypothetical protein
VNNERKSNPNLIQMKLFIYALLSMHDYATLLTIAAFIGAQAAPCGSDAERFCASFLKIASRSWFVLTAVIIVAAALYFFL